MKLASIERLHSVRTHGNADSLLCGKILGWPVVFRKGDFVEGSLGVFIYPDVVVDGSNPAFAFLEPKHFKVWVAKFRGERSAGLLMPLSLLNDYLPKDAGIEPGKAIEFLTEGTDVGELIKCVKFEKPLPKDDAALGGFPTYILPITDEDNLLSNPGAWDELVAAGPAYITLKCDGSSGTFISLNGETKICRRRQELKPDGNNAWVNAVKQYQMVEKLGHLNLAVQFEVVGPKLNDNRMKLSKNEIYVFNVKDLNSGEFYSYIDLAFFCEENKLPMVPTLKDNVDLTQESIDAMIELADSVTYDGGIKGEGIVIRPQTPVNSELLGRNLSVKVINSNYKQ